MDWSKIAPHIGLGASVGGPPQGMQPNLGQALSDQQMIAPSIANQAALQQASIAANMPHVAAANVPPSQPGFHAEYMGRGQFPLRMAVATGYIQSAPQNLFTTSQNAIARPFTQVNQAFSK